MISGLSRGTAMTDAAYCLRQDERERKSLARMSRYKKNGSKTQYVRLPQTYMTEKEICKMHGEIKTLSLGKKYSKDEFLAFNDDLRRLYVQNLIDNYGARRKDIADMLGLSYGGFVHMCRRLFPVSPFKNEGKGAKPTKEWLDFVDKGTVVLKPPTVSAAVSAPAVTEKVELPEKKDEKPPRKTELTTLRVRYIGSVTDAFTEVFNLVGNEKDFVINIELYPAAAETPALSTF